MNKPLLTLFAVLAVGLVVASQSMFTVEQTAQAIVLQLGEPKGESRGPGLHFKIPLIQDVRYFDRRVLSIDPAPVQMVISSSTFTQKTKEEQENETEEEAAIIRNVTGEPIIVDTFARYKIVDPLRFMKTLGSIKIANDRIEATLNNTTRAVLGQTTLEELLSIKRTAVMETIRSRVNNKIEQDKLGVQIVDVRIVRADLTAELRTSTVRRMQSELRKRATETRAIGEEKALEIRSTADKEVTVIIAEAQRDGEIIRGAGDETAIKIYASAFNKDKEFYAFIRSMEAYKNTLATPETRLILSPNSEFFRYFNQQN